MRGLGVLLARKTPDTPEPAAAGPRGWVWEDWDDFRSNAISGPPVTRAKAEGLPAVGRGVNLVADVVASMAPDALKHADDPDTPIEVLPRPPVLADPDPAWHGPATWRAAAVRDMQWEGNTFADASLDVDPRSGYPNSLRLIPPSCVSWEPSARYRDRRKVYMVSDPEGSGGRWEVDAADMFHAAVNVDSGARMGRGILHIYQDTLKLIAAVERATFVVMRDGKPVGVLSVDVDMGVDELKEVKAAFKAGVRNDGIAALIKAEFREVSWSAEDLSLIPAREFNMRLGSDMTGVTPYLLGVPSESRVYANIESEWSNFIRVTVNRYTGPLNDALTRRVPRGQVVRHNTDELARPEAKTRWEIHKIAMELGATTVAEIRQDERMGPMPAKEDAA